MPRFRFAKLVRNLIVKQQIASGARPYCRYLAGYQLVHALVKKIGEEAGEALAAFPDKTAVTKEIADLQQLVDDLKATMGISSQDVATAQALKNAAAGSFSEGLYVEYVDVAEDNPWIPYYRQHPDRYPQIG